LHLTHDAKAAPFSLREQGGLILNHVHRMARFLKTHAPNVFVLEPTLDIPQVYLPYMEAQLYAVLEQNRKTLQEPLKISDPNPQEDLDFSFIIEGLVEAASCDADWISRTTPLLERVVQSMVAIKRQARKNRGIFRGAEEKSTEYYLNILKQQINMKLAEKREKEWVKATQQIKQLDEQDELLVLSALRYISEKLLFLAQGSQHNLLRVAKFLRDFSANRASLIRENVEVYKELALIGELFNPQVESLFMQPHEETTELNQIIDHWFYLYYRMHGVKELSNRIKFIAAYTEDVVKPVQWYFNIYFLSKITGSEMPLQMQQGIAHSPLYYVFLQRSRHINLDESSWLKVASENVNDFNSMLQNMIKSIKKLSPQVAVHDVTLSLSDVLSPLTEAFLYNVWLIYYDFIINSEGRHDSEIDPAAEPDFSTIIDLLVQAATYDSKWLLEVNPMVKKIVEAMVTLKKQYNPAISTAESSSEFYLDFIVKEVAKRVHPVSPNSYMPSTEQVALGVGVMVIGIPLALKFMPLFRGANKNPKETVREKDIAKELAALPDLDNEIANASTLQEEFARGMGELKDFLNIATQKIAVITSRSSSELIEAANVTIQQMKTTFASVKIKMDAVHKSTALLTETIHVRRRKLKDLQPFTEKDTMPLVATQLTKLESHEKTVNKLSEQAKEASRAIDDVHKKIADIEDSFQKQKAPPIALNIALPALIRRKDSKLAEAVYREITTFFKEKKMKKQLKEWDDSPRKQQDILLFIESNSNRKLNLEAQLIAAIDQGVITEAVQLPRWLAVHYMQVTMPGSGIDIVEIRPTMLVFPTVPVPAVAPNTQQVTHEPIPTEDNSAEAPEPAVAIASSAITVTYEPIVEEAKHGEITIVFRHPHADVIRQIFQDIKETIYWIDEAIQLLDDGLASQSLFDDITQNLTIKAAQDNMIYQIILFNEKCKELENTPGGKQLVDGLITNRRQLIAVRNYLAHEPDKIKYDWIFDSNLLHCAQEVAQLKTTSLKWKAINSQWQPTLMLEDAPGAMNTDELLQRFVRSSKDKQAQPSDEEFLDSALQTIKRYLQEIQRIHELLNKNNLPQREQVELRKKHIQFERALSFKMACYAEKDPQDMISNGMQFRHKLFHDPKQLHPQEIEKIQGQFVQLITARDIAGSSAIMKVAAAL